MVIGIAGGTSSGKTTTAQYFFTMWGGDTSCVLLRADDYYIPHKKLTLAERAELNYDHPDSIDSNLLAEHIRQLKNGKPIQVPVYDFTIHDRFDTSKWRTVQPKPIIIVEGILVLHYDAIREQCDHTLFVATPDDERLARRIERDTTERGRTMSSVLAQWRKTVQPMHLAFCEPSKRHAKLIIPEGGGNIEALTIVRHGIEYLSQQS